MLDIPENIKDLFRSDNRRKETHKKFRLKFYEDSVDSLYPYETLYPDEGLFPSEHETAWLTIENDRIVSESLQITESLSSDQDMVFGSCEGAELQITVADVSQDLSDKEFTLTVEIGGYEMALGIYTVKSFERESDRRRRKITAYDRMDWFNVDVSDWYNSLSFPINVKTFRDSLCSYIGIQQKDINLLFDSLQISKTIEPTQLSGLDVLIALCEINGCFGHIDKTGQLAYVYLQQSGLYPDETLYPEEELYPSEFGGDGEPIETISSYKQPMTYEDYLVNGISGLTIRQEEGDVGASVGDGENVYTIEGNFLIYGKSAADLLDIAESLLPVISGREYRPCSLDCNCMPWMEVGDAIIIPTKDDLVETFVMKRTMSGCQNMRDTIESTGSQKREGDFTIQKQIIQLEGRTAIIQRTVEEVSVQVTNLKDYTDAQLSITSEAITAEVTRAQEAESQLSIAADEISASVTALEEEATSKITQTANQITAEVKRATEAEGNLSARITATESEISLKVSKGSVSSEISVESGGVNITGNRFSWTSTNSSMTADGTLNCKNINATNGRFSGNITGSTITGGTITGTTITGDTISGSNINGATITGATIESTDITANRITAIDNAQFNFCRATNIDCEGQLNANIVEVDYLSYGQANHYSDRRLKENIKDISSETAISVLTKLRPVEFNFINTKIKSLGFIAQEVQEVLDEENLDWNICSVGDDGYYRLSYSDFIAIITKCVQELSRQVLELEDGGNIA